MAGRPGTDSWPTHTDDFVRLIASVVGEKNAEIALNDDRYLPLVMSVVVDSEDLEARYELKKAFGIAPSVDFFSYVTKGAL